MAAPTSTYANYATGNDYKGATFTDGAYTSATKTLVKNAAFAASKVNHWLWLESNDGGSIVAGYYKIATWTDANTVILATDAGAGVDDDAAKCTQHDGTTSKPWRSVQGALDLITRDATNGDQVNPIAGTAQVLAASLALTTYGTPAEGAPLTIRGCTAIANDGGIAEIDCNGATMFAAANIVNTVDLLIHNFGNNNGVTTNGSVQHCKVHKGASTPSGKYLVIAVHVAGCWVYDAGTSGIGINGFAIGNYVYNCPTGIISTGIASSVIRNIVVDCAAGILCTTGDQFVIDGNSVYSSTANTGTGINASDGATRTRAVVINNVVEGYSGVGGKGIASTGDIAILGYNTLFNNSTPKSLGDVIVDLGGDCTPASSPFTNAAGGDFSLSTSVAGNGREVAFPGTWYGLAGTTNKQDIGAVQNGAGAGGGVIRRVARLLGG